MHALLDITDLDALLGHPVVGSSYESFVVECLVDAAGPGYRPFHYRTARGEEIDLLLTRGETPAIAIEVKRSPAPVVSAGFHRACADLGVPRRYVVHPTLESRAPRPKEAYRTSEGVDVIGLTALVTMLRASPS